MKYYVTHPNLEISALVEAPTTDKARTTYLDWMERSSHIQRRDRQYWRRSMIAERLDYPEDVTVDIELNYGYEDSAPITLPQTQEYTEQVEYSDPDVEVTVQEPPPPTTLAEATPRMSPIARQSLGVK
jgi:hypothetical protein